MSHVVFGGRVMRRLPEWYITPEPTDALRGTRLTTCCCLVYVRTEKLNGAQPVFVVQRCPNKTPHVRGIGELAAHNAFCEKHTTDWKDTVAEYKKLVRTRTKNDGSIAKYHRKFSVDVIFESYMRRVFLQRWFCSTDFKGDSDRGDDSFTLVGDVIASREGGTLMLQVAHQYCAMRLRGPDNTFLDAPVTLFTRPRAPPPAATQPPAPILDPSAFPPLPSRIALTGQQSSVRELANSLKKKRSGFDADPMEADDPIKTWPRLDILNMTDDECRAFLAESKANVTYIERSDAQYTADTWYGVYETERIGVVFDDARIVVGVCESTRAMDEETFEVTFDHSEGMTALRYANNGWVEEPASATYAFKVPPLPGHPIVYMGGDVETLLGYARQGGSVRALPPRTKETEYDYTRGMAPMWGS